MTKWSATLKEEGRISLTPKQAKRAARHVKLIEDTLSFAEQIEHEGDLVVMSAYEYNTGGTGMILSDSTGSKQSFIKWLYKRAEKRKKELLRMGIEYVRQQEDN